MIGSLMQNSLSETWSSKEQLFPGLWVYRNVIKKELNLSQRLEEELSLSSLHSWQKAKVGTDKKDSDYRDCFDFKIRKNNFGLSNEYDVLNSIWQDTYDAKNPALIDYCNMYNIQMNYWEQFNFVKYGPGNYFKEHADHGFSYVATVSMVGYINEDYVGGELVFPKIGIQVKPKSGDLYIFPSTYLFSHAAMPISEGIKYSIVTMTDYNDDHHGEDFSQLIKKRKQDKIIKGD
jgi:hypothetical protein